MNRKSKVVVSIVGITIVLLALLGITYAYYLTRIEGNTNTNSISVTTANLKLVYSDNSEEIITGDSALMPSSEPIGEKSFTVTNAGNDSEYSVIIDEVSTKIAGTNTSTSFLSNDFRYTLTCTITSTDETRNGTTCNNISEQKLFPINGGVMTSNSIKEGDIHNYKLTLWYIDTGIDQSDDMGKSYQARVNIVDITVNNPYSTGVSETDNKSLVYNIINNAKQNKNGTSLVNVPLTTPVVETSYLYKTDEVEIATTENSVSISTTYQGRYWTYATDYVVDEKTGNFSLVEPKICKYSDSNCISDLISVEDTIYIVSMSPSSNSNTSETLKTTTNLSNIYLVTNAPASTTSSITMKVKKLTSILYNAESVLSTTQDNYGTSYYFRGGVQDNYVLFNNICFRIVRIEGDGSVKLILAGEVETGANDCTGVTDTSAVINSGASVTYGYKTITGLDGNTWYIADYENDGKTSTDITGNIETSLKESLDTWFDSKFMNDGVLTAAGEKIKEETWCLGGSYDYKYNDSTGDLLDDAGLNTIYTNDSYLYWNYSSGKRLWTTKTTDLTCGIDEEKITSRVGTLTSDEVALAGADGSYNANYTYYLYDNAKSMYYWTLSRSLFNGDIDGSFGVGEAGNLFTNCVNFSDPGSRPAVTLITGTEISTGIGTKDKPYIIDEN